jgi:acyl-CoA thioesterase FadM
VRVVCWIDRLGSRSIGFAYEARKGDELLVTGRTDHLWLGAASGRPCRMPEFLQEPFARLAGKAGTH